MTSPVASLHRFQEAVDWFRERVPMTETQFSRLSERAQQRAFTVAGVSNLNVVKAVWKAIDGAIEKGETFESFKVRVGSRLSKAWGPVDNPIARLETVFRNNVQAAYNAGRVRQLKDPDMMQALPFWRFAAILDARTTVLICRPLANTVLPANAAWFRTRVPPLHHRCRSTIVGISKRAADRVGVTQRPTRERGSPGFGLIEEDFTPDLSAVPGRLVKVFERKQRAAKQARRRAGKESV